MAFIKLKKSGEQTEVLYNETHMVSAQEEIRGRASLTKIKFSDGTEIVFDLPFHKFAEFAEVKQPALVARLNADDD